MDLLCFGSTKEKEEDSKLLTNAIKVDVMANYFYSSYLTYLGFVKYLWVNLVTAPLKRSRKHIYFVSPPLHRKRKTYNKLDGYG